MIYKSLKVTSENGNPDSYEEDKKLLDLRANLHHCSLNSNKMYIFVTLKM